MWFTMIVERYGLESNRYNVACLILYYCQTSYVI